MSVSGALFTATMAADLLTLIDDNIKKNRDNPVVLKILNGLRASTIKAQSNIVDDTVNLDKLNDLKTKMELALPYFSTGAVASQVRKRYDEILTDIRGLNNSVRKQENDLTNLQLQANAAITAQESESGPLKKWLWDVPKQVISNVFTPGNITKVEDNV